MENTNNRNSNVISVIAITSLFVAVVVGSWLISNGDINMDKGKDKITYLVKDSNGSIGIIGLQEGNSSAEGLTELYKVVPVVPTPAQMSNMDCTTSVDLNKSTNMKMHLVMDCKINIVYDLAKTLQMKD